MNQIETLFESLGVPQACITNPSLCAISYVSNASDNDCCNGLCPPARIEQINLLEILAPIALQSEAINNIVRYLRLFEPFGIYDDIAVGSHVYGGGFAPFDDFNSSVYFRLKNFVTNYQISHNQLTNGATGSIVVPDITTLFTIDGTNKEFSRSSRSEKFTSIEDLKSILMLNGVSVYNI